MRLESIAENKAVTKKYPGGMIQSKRQDCDVSKLMVMDDGVYRSLFSTGGGNYGSWTRCT